MPTSEVPNHPRRCELLGVDQPVTPGYLLSFERWPFHAVPPDHYALAFALVRLVCLAVIAPFCHCTRRTVANRAEGNLWKPPVPFWGDHFDQTTRQAVSMHQHVRTRRTEGGISRSAFRVDRGPPLQASHLGASLPSSLAVTRSSACGSSPRPPVSVSGTGPRGLKLSGFSREPPSPRCRLARRLGVLSQLSRGRVLHSPPIPSCFNPQFRLRAAVPVLRPRFASAEGTGMLTRRPSHRPATAGRP